MPRVLLAEASAPQTAAWRRFLEGWLELKATTTLDEAVQATRAQAPDLVVACVSGALDGEVLCAQVKKVAPRQAVVLVYPAEEAQPWGRAQTAGADGYLSLPLKKSAVVGTLQLVLQGRALKEKVALLEADLARVRGQAKVPVPASVVKAPWTPTSLNQFDEAFFKKYLLLEVKRSKRYQYPSALMVVAIDHLDRHTERSAEPAVLREAARSDIMGILGEMLRDIDVALPFGEDRVLVFLPHTPRQGALIVADRMVERMRNLKSLPECTVSVGLASYEPRAGEAGKVSFGGLVRDATTALKVAQTAGGDRLEAGAAPPRPKKDRISLG